MPDLVQRIVESRFVLEEAGPEGRRLQVLRALHGGAGDNDLAGNRQAHREAQHAEGMAAPEVEDAYIVVEREIAFVARDAPPRQVGPDPGVGIPPREVA